MSTQQIITTFAGAFIFPFIIHLAWGKMVEAWGAAGGFMAALFIVGTSWVLNHGYGLIVQSNDVWVDMGLAAGVGLFVASVVEGNSLSKGSKVFLYAIIGALLGGFIIS